MCKTVMEEIIKIYWKTLKEILSKWLEDSLS